MGEEREPTVPEHGYWSSRTDDLDGDEPQNSSQPEPTVLFDSSAPQLPQEPSTAEPPTAEPAPPRAPTAALGWVALALAALCVIADVVAVVLAVQRYWVSATLIAEGANVATVIVFVVALFAAWRRPARWLGIIAMVVAILANPFILSHLLAFLGG